MGAKHRMTDLPERRRRALVSRARLNTSGSTTIVDLACASVLCAASLAALLSQAHGSRPKHPRAQQIGMVHEGNFRRPQPSGSRKGTLIAVSSESVTARSANAQTTQPTVSARTPAPHHCRLHR